ncbi:hypothetical protein RI367_003894 [Sorochytrium milnesiophthora]
MSSAQPSQSPTADPGSSGSSSSSSGGKTAGIVIGVVAVLILLIALWMRKIRSESSKHAAQAQAAPAPPPVEPPAPARPSPPPQQLGSSPYLLAASNAPSTHSLNNNSYMQQQPQMTPASLAPGVGPGFVMPNNPSPQFGATPYPPPHQQLVQPGFSPAVVASGGMSATGLGVNIPAPAPPQHIEMQQTGGATGDVRLVISAFDQIEAADELLLQIGDRVRMERVFDDGWAFGYNLSSKKSGMFPLLCVSQVSEDQQLAAQAAQYSYGVAGSGSRGHLPDRTLSRQPR